MPSQTIGTSTYPGIGMAQARNQLQTRTDLTFFRAIVVSSDGLPNTGTLKANDEADKAWASDIHIWSIVFHNGSFDAKYMADLIRGVGFSQVSPKVTDLPIMFENVAKSLPTTLVD